MTETQGTVVLSPEMVDLLGDMGLSFREVQTYQYLLGLVAATPSAIARDTAQPRGRIYEGMRNLVEKGFVREEPTRPIQFSATPLAEILAAAHGRLSRHLKVVALGQRMAGMAVALLPPPTAPVRLRDVRVLSGRRSSHAELARMIHASTQFCWIRGGGNFAERLAHVAPLLESLQAAAARGVDVQLILPRSRALEGWIDGLPAGSPRPALQQVAAEGAEPIISCATEAASLELVAQPDDRVAYRGDDIAIQVSSPLFASSVQRRLEKRPAVPQQVAPAAYPWLGPNHGSDVFLDALRRAKRDVVVLGPRAWSDYVDLGWDRSGAIFETAKAQGVRLRALVMADDAPAPQLARIAGPWEVKRVAKGPLWLTLIDDVELFQAFAHGPMGGPPRFRESSDPKEVRFYKSIVERLWQNGTIPDAGRPASISGSLAP